MVRRVVTDLHRPGEEQRFRLLWGPEIVANPRDPIGLGLLRRGVFDLLVCEVLLRLADPGETALDVGANVGHMTSLLAHAVGEHGRVIAFEPHPEVFGRLEKNAARWSALSRSGVIDLRQTGLSDVDGEAILATDVFEINQGSASLEPLTQRRGRVDEHSVCVRRLDTVLADEGDVGVMKIDIEDHELRAFQGGAESLRAGRIRDIVFEERQPPPTAVTRLLEECGYTVVRLGEHLRGPLMAPIAGSALGSKDDPSLLATRDPDRAVERLRARGWAIYGLGPAGRSDRDRRHSDSGHSPISRGGASDC